MFDDTHAQEPDDLPAWADAATTPGTARRARSEPAPPLSRSRIQKRLPFAVAAVGVGVAALLLPNLRSTSTPAAARDAVASLLDDDATAPGVRNAILALSDTYGSTTLANAVRHVGQAELRIGESNKDPSTAAGAFVRAAACYEYLARDSPALLEIAADALDQAGDLHCELGQASESRECHRRSHAHFTTLLNVTGTTSEAHARFAEKQKIAARYMVNSNCP